MLGDADWSETESTLRKLAHDEDFDGRLLSAREEEIVADERRKMDDRHSWGAHSSTLD